MKKKEIIIIAIIMAMAAIATGILLFAKTEKTIAVVYHGDVEIMRFDISKDAVYHLEGDYGAFNIEVKDSRYRAYDVDCPNHDCEKVGWVEKGSFATITCHPNRIFIVQE